MVADGNLSEGGLARNIGSWFKKGCVLLCCSSSELLLMFTGTGQNGPECSVQTLSSGSFFFWRGSCCQAGIVYVAE
jgi:hypothetical protein